MTRRLLTPLAITALALPAAAIASNPAATWNSGYNGWWPSGFGYPPQTVSAHGYPCSATAYGPTFESSRRGWHQHDGAGVSCTGGVGTKTATLSVQVLGPNGHRWFTVRGTPTTTGPSNGNPVRIIRTRPAVPGHEYRTVVVARLVVPNGHAGCSLTNSCNQTLTITAISRGLAP